MKASSRVIQNSLWLGIQPLILNVVSIFATAYIVRGISQDDYGHFIVAFSLVALVTPLCGLGVRAVLVRDIAADLDSAPVIIGRVFSLRLLLAVATYGIAAITVNVLQYPTITKMLTYMACSTLIFNTISNTLIDAFQGYERMKFMAVGNLISGSLLTLMSVLAIMFGFGVVGLTVAYVIGPITLAIVMFLFYTKELPRFKLEVNTGTWRDMLKKGMPFFSVGMLWMFIAKVGIIILSKVQGDEQVAVYGAASGLVGRLIIVPDSIGTALFPAISALFARQATGEINATLRKAFEYMIIFGVGIAVGMSLLSTKIMALIYGSAYASGGIVLSIISWYVPFWFAMVLFVYCLGAVHMQGKVLSSIIASTVVGLVGYFLLIPRFGAVGLSVAYLVFYVVYCGLGFQVVHRHLGFRIDWSMLTRILLANLVLAGAVLLLRSYNLALAIIVPGLLYVAVLFVTGAVSKSDFDRVRQAVFKGASDASDSADGEKEVPADV